MDWAVRHRSPVLCNIGISFQSRLMTSSARSLKAAALPASDPSWATGGSGWRSAWGSTNTRASFCLPLAGTQHRRPRPMGNGNAAMACSNLLASPSGQTGEKPSRRSIVARSGRDREPRSATCRAPHPVPVSAKTSRTARHCGCDGKLWGRADSLEGVLAREGHRTKGTRRATFWPCLKVESRAALVASQAPMFWPTRASTLTQAALKRSLGFVAISVSAAHSTAIAFSRRASSPPARVPKAPFQRHSTGRTAPPSAVDLLRQQTVSSQTTDMPAQTNDEFYGLPREICIERQSGYRLKRFRQLHRRRFGQLRRRFAFRNCRSSTLLAAVASTS